MLYIGFVFLSSILVNLISVIYSSFIYSQVNGTFKSPMRLVMSINFKENTGFLLFGIDTKKNRLLIRVKEKEFNSKEIVFNFNSRKFETDAILVTNISTHRLYQLRVLLRFHHDNLYLNYDDQVVAANVFVKDWIYPDPFEGYPIPINYENETNKIFLWMWNIGPYVGQNGKLYNGFQNQLIGCIHELFVDYQLVHFKKYGDISAYCVKTYNEKICEKSLCSSKEAAENILDCSISSMNVQGYCYKDLSSWTDHGYIYKRISWQRGSIPIKLAWKQKFASNYCLMKISSRNGSSIMFYTNIQNQIIMLSNKVEKIIFSEILPNKINILFINFQHPYILIKATNGRTISTNVEEFILEPYKIDLKTNSYYNVCTLFNEKSALKYYVSQFRLVGQSCTSEKFQIAEIEWKIIACCVIVLSLISNICIFWIFRRRHLKQTINHYEMENVSLPPVPVQDREPDVYDYVKI